MNIAVSAAAVVAAPSIAAATALADDAEILEHGRNFQALMDRFMTAWFEWAKRMRAAHYETEEKFGRKFEGSGWRRTFDAGRCNDGPAWHHLHESIKRHDVRTADKALDPIRAEIERLAELILDHESHTLAGLRARTLVAMFDMRPMRACHEGHLTCEADESMVALFENAVTLTGLSDYYGEFAQRIAEDAPEVEQEDNEEAA